MLAESAEQDQPARTCRLILLHILRKNASMVGNRMISVDIVDSVMCIERRILLDKVMGIVRREWHKQKS